MSQVDRAAAQLFPTEGGKIRNIKFLCGGQPNVSAEEVAEMILRAESQVRSGAVKRLETIDSHLTQRQ